MLFLFNVEGFYCTLAFSVDVEILGLLEIVSHPHLYCGFGFLRVSRTIKRATIKRTTYLSELLSRSTSPVH